MSTNDYNEQNFLRWMESRRVESHSVDFSQRIINASSRITQYRGVDLYSWIKGLFSEFVLPQPVYALTPLLILGLVLGFITPYNSAIHMTSNVASQSYFIDDEDSL